MLTYWDSKPHVIEATGDDDWFDWETELKQDPAWRELLIAMHGDRPIGLLQIIDPQLEETQYWGDVEPNLRAIDIWIGEEDDLGHGFGTEMMDLALQRCFDDAGVTRVLIDPLETNTRAHRFYKRLGFEEVGPRVFEKDRCLVFELTREAWERNR